MDILQLIKDGINKGVSIMVPVYGVKERDARKVKAWKSSEEVDKSIEKFQEQNKEVKIIKEEGKI